MNLPDFQSQEAGIIVAAIRAIHEFASSSTEVFRQFAFDCNPDYGEVLFCLDTEASSKRFAREHGDTLATDRAKRVNYVDHLEWAISAIERPDMPVVPFNNNVGDYSHQGFADYSFAGWNDFRFSDQYPGEFESSKNDYLSCVASVLLSHAADKLVEREAFGSLRITSPFLVGFQLHDGFHTLVRIINW
jgi:hypothetical protein